MRTCSERAVGLRKGGVEESIYSIERKILVSRFRNPLWWRYSQSSTGTDPFEREASLIATVFIMLFYYVLRDGTFVAAHRGGFATNR
jgi:hypothetical protein